MPARIGVLYVDGPGSAITPDALAAESGRFDVAAEPEASDALDRLAADPGTLDCVVSRYRLPNGDGLALIEAVRDDFPDIPFVLLVDTLDDGVVTEALSAGATDCLPATADGAVGVLADRVTTAVERHRGDRALEGRPHRFSELAGATDEVFYMFSADWETLLFVNAAYEDLWGRSIEALWDDPEDFLAGVHPDDRERVTAAMERVSNGTSAQVEYRVNAEEDYGRWVSARGEPIYDDAGEVVRVAGFVRDVTERRERERELRRERNRYATLFENLPNPVAHVVATESGPAVRAVNPAFEETFGHDGAAIEGERLHAVLTGDEEEEAALERRLLTESVVQTEVQRATDDGLRNFQLDVAMQDAAVETPEGYAIYTDVTERRERSRQLQRERDRLRAFFEAVPQPVVHFTMEDGEPLVQRVNESFETVFGHPESEAVGESVIDLVVPDRLEEEARDISRDIRASDSIQREVRRAAADGERDFLFRTRKLQLSDRTEVLGIYVDITEQKRRQEQLQRQNERLDEYASLISHDLRNPLNVLVGSIEMAEETGEQSHFDRCRRAADRMEQLIDDLLTLARQGDQVDEMEPVSLDRVVRECWETTATADATLRVEVDRTVRADPGRLKQLLGNLFRNSVEHGSTSSRSQTDDAVEHGGSGVTVTVGALADGTGFHVADDGQGIPPDRRDQVFESGYSTSSDGTGFGLLIVRRIAEAHGWDVRVTESETGGARFEITGVDSAS